MAVSKIQWKPIEELSIINPSTGGSIVVSVLNHFMVFLCADILVNHHAAYGWVIITHVPDEYKPSNRIYTRAFDSDHNQYDLYIGKNDNVVHNVQEIPDNTRLQFNMQWSIL